MNDALNQYVFISEAVVSKDFDLKRVMVEDKLSGREVEAITYEGLFTEAEAGNQNTRWYPESIVKREHDSLNDKIKKNGGLLMELDHPVIIAETKKDIMRASKILLKDACGMIREPFAWHGKEVHGKVEILSEEPLGQKLISLGRRGWKMGVSSRSIGGKPTVDPSSGLQIVPENIRFITYDFVENPSVHNARLQQVINEEIEQMLFNEKNSHTQKVWQVIKNFADRKF